LVVGGVGYFSLTIVLGRFPPYSVYTGFWLFSF